MTQIITLNESPIPRKYFFDLASNVVTANIDELVQSLQIPQSVQEQSKDLSEKSFSDSFGQHRALYIENLRAITIYLFNQFSPNTSVSLLEIGPGPQNYAYNKLLPLKWKNYEDIDITTTINYYSAIEISKSYARKIKNKLRYRQEKCNIFNGDMHNIQLNKQFDVIFSLSSLDSTAFPCDLMKNIYKLLKPDGRVIWIQDVFPCDYAILGQEYNKKWLYANKEIKFGDRSSIDMDIIWIQDLSDTTWLTFEYLKNSLVQSALENNFDIIENSIYGDSRIVENKRPYSKGIGKRNNTRTIYYIEKFAHEENIPKGYLKLNYFVDVLVLGKNNVNNTFV